jgi:hypothetical protein
VRRTETTIENPTSWLVPIDVAQDRIEDETKWKVSPSLAQDAPSIRQALQALIQGYPFFHVGHGSPRHRSARPLP